MIDDDDPLLDDETQRRACRRRNRTVTGGTFVLTALMVLAVVDGVGLVDAFGVDSGTVQAGAGSTTLVVEHPRVTRPGLASPLTITVEQAGGFTTDIVDVAIDLDYLALWDFNGVVPVPAEETADARRVIWTFPAPEGEVLTIHLDARIEPARQSGTDGRVAVLDPDGTELVAVVLTTRIRP